jgi:uncharacterized membrane protein YadS
MVERRRHPEITGKKPPVVPLFVLGFLAMIGIRGLLPTEILHGASTLTTLLLAGALFGLGTTVRAPALVRTGPKALLLGLCSTLLVATVAFVALRLFA